jgi:arylsulfatase
MKRGAALVAIAFAACGPEARPLPAPAARATPARGGSGVSVLLITIDTLRADHLGAYGYHRTTSPHIDALAREGTLFGQAYTFWPKTRGSFAMIMTGRRPSQNGYSKAHPGVLGFNATIASVLKQAGYQTVASVDNPNLATVHGYAKGFDRYRETWEEKALATEMDRARAITADGVAFLKAATRAQPFFLWLHYVNPHAPYEPPPPFDGAFADAQAKGGPLLAAVSGFHGGVHQQWLAPGKKRLGEYVALYDGEIAAADREAGEVLDALAASAVKDRTLVVLTSDHGESLGEHDYYFDHGEDLFDPCLHIPLVIVAPGAARGRRADVLASTLDLFPTILDAVKVSYPPDLAGVSLMGAVRADGREPRERLFAQNERSLSAAFDRRLKVIATPEGDVQRFALYDRGADPGETTDVAVARGDELRGGRRELELFFERADREWPRTKALIGNAPAGEAKMSVEACEKLKALGYVQQCAP